MEWLSILAFLACPLMMLFCMKGMFSGNKDKEVKNVQPQVSPQDLQTMQIRMAEMMEQNHKLMKEIETIKTSTSTQETASNVVELREEQTAKAKKGVS
jgi:hypothetical protein